MAYIGVPFELYSGHSYPPPPGELFHVPRSCRLQVAVGDVLLSHTKHKIKLDIDYHGLQAILSSCFHWKSYVATVSAR